MYFGLHVSQHTWVDVLGENRPQDLTSVRQNFLSANFKISYRSNKLHILVNVCKTFILELN